MWKALNDSQYPLREEQKSETKDGIGTRRTICLFDFNVFCKKACLKKLFLNTIEN